MIKNKKQLVLTCATLTLMTILSACSTQAAQESGDSNNTVSNGSNVPAAESIADTSKASTSAAKPAEAEVNQNKQLPENMPADFPLPADAKIELAQSGEQGGKKSVMIIFTTPEDLKAVSDMYKDYFATKAMTDAVETIDEKNIIIQGTDTEAHEKWSLIGGVMASKDGSVELTMTWSEI
ncbi:hypothetical protein [Paenibacillus massiliensis]|uniref:hypothetical protein n=1 Tax=Paenibacillus massiliensis TaxID=225917 RepID=UPI00037BB6EF|nr:hypothetical protein [Paenibacillus massiliensis]